MLRGDADNAGRQGEAVRAQRRNGILQDSGDKISRKAAAAGRDDGLFRRYFADIPRLRKGRRGRVQRRCGTGTVHRLRRR